MKHEFSCYINNFSWLGRQDSNLGSRDQNPLPYRLATPQQFSEGVSAASRLSKLTCSKRADDGAISEKHRPDALRRPDHTGCDKRPQRGETGLDATFHASFYSALQGHTQPSIYGRFSRHGV